MGDQNYLAVSFWSGNDHLTCMPRVAFAINVDGNTTLEFNSKDISKTQFFNYSLLENLGIDPIPNQVHTENITGTSKIKITLPPLSPFSLMIK
ncbi:hypothetical protein FHW89_002579 [Mucilaginibacter sp. SG564]|nr:hypothetical protein [Mucilaginibacter sp. SG564]